LIILIILREERKCIVHTYIYTHTSMYIHACNVFTPIQPISQIHVFQ
jgi:hypothetical protein